MVVAATINTRVGIGSCIFRDNINTNNATGLITVQGSTNTTINYCNFTNNRAVNAGCLLSRSSVLYITSCVFSRNVVTGEAGALYMVQSPSTIRTSTFERNAAGRLGGAIVLRDTTATFAPAWSNLTFSLNSAEDGWALFWEGRGTMTLDYSQFLSNYNTSSNGAVVSLGNATCTITATDVFVLDRPGMAVNQFRVSSVLATSLVNCNCRGNTCGSWLCDTCQPAGVCASSRRCLADCSSNDTNSTPPLTCLDGRNCGCLPSCFLLSCGPDGCGGQCGYCTVTANSTANTTCVNGACACDNCPPNAACGFNLCGNPCGGINGRCAVGTCNNFACTCQPNCNNSRCADGCGGFCAPCAPDELCTPSGFCVQAPCTTNCSRLSCGESDGCNGICPCPTGVCLNNTCCPPNCSGLLCGSDGCGGSCGLCSATEDCLAGSCVVRPLPNITYNETELPSNSSDSCEPNCSTAACGGDDSCGGTCQCEEESEASNHLPLAAIIGGSVAGALLLILLIALLVFFLCCRDKGDDDVEIVFTTYPQPDSDSATLEDTDLRNSAVTASASLDVYERISLPPKPEPEPGLMIYQSTKDVKPPRRGRRKTRAKTAL